MDAREVQQILVNCGWPISVDGNIGPQSKSAIKAFQWAWCFEDLAVDGVVGPRTEAVLRDANGNGHKPARFFTYREFASKGNGWISVDRELLKLLDRYRDQVGPVGIVSGYRDPDHNRKVGGAANSQHLYGRACDLATKRWKPEQWRRIGAPGGLGVGRDGMVLHVDTGPNRSWNY